MKNMHDLYSYYSFYSYKDKLYTKLEQIVNKQYRRSEI